MNALLSILTIEKKARILDTKSVRGHAGIVPIILFSNVGNHKNCGCSKSLDVDGLGAGQPRGGKKIRIKHHMTKPYLMEKMPRFSQISQSVR